MSKSKKLKLTPAQIKRAHARLEVLGGIHARLVEQHTEATSKLCKIGLFDPAASRTWDRINDRCIKIETERHAIEATLPGMPRLPS